MPSSAVTRDDLRAKLYSAGIKNPRVLTEAMKWVDIYCLRVVRKSQRLEDVEIAIPSFTELKPGEWSVALEVTCCASCEQVKRWDLFHIDKRHTTGHQVKCKECRNRKDEEEGLPPYTPESVKRGGWICSGEGSCGVRKKPEEFPEEKQRYPRSHVLCNDCADDI